MRDLGRLGSKLSVVLCLSLAAPSVAFAQPKPPAAAGKKPAPPKQLGDTLTGSAKADYESGKLLFQDGDYTNAFKKFESGYAASNDPRLLWNMAACQKNLRHYGKVTVLVRKYIETGGDLISDQDRSEAKELLRAVEPLTSSVTFTVNEPDAEVFLDEESLGTTPLKAPVVTEVGPHKLRAKKDGFEEFVQDVNFNKAETALEVALKKVLHEGKLVVRASEGDSVLLDGKNVGSGGYTATLAGGHYILRVTAPKKKPYQADVVIQPGRDREINVKLEDEAWSPPLWLWITGGVVLVAGGATATYFAVSGSDKKAEYDGPKGTLSPFIVEASQGGLRF